MNVPHERAPVVYPAIHHEHTLIVLHGRGDFPSQFGPGFFMEPTSYHNEDGRPLDLNELMPNTKFIFPSAKQIPAKCFDYQETLNQWFDIESLGETTRNEHLQIPGLRESAIYLRQIIEDEIAAGTPAERIILAGLSQGCATALFFLLTYQPTGTGVYPLPRLGAVVGMNGWLPFVSRLHALSMLSEKNEGHVKNLDSKEPQNRSDSGSIDVLQELCKLTSLPTLPTNTRILATPVFLGHGELDTKIRLRHGQLARDVLRKLSIDVEWREYAGEGHWYCQDEMDDVVKFLEEKVGIRLNLSGQSARLASTHAEADGPSPPAEAQSINIVFED